MGETDAATMLLRKREEGKFDEAAQLLKTLIVVSCKSEKGTYDKVMDKLRITSWRR